MMMLCSECGGVIPVPGVERCRQVQCSTCAARFEIQITLLAASPLGARELAERRNVNH